MVGTVEAGDPDIDQREASDNTILGGLLGTCTNGRDVFTGNNTALDLIDKLETTTRLKRLKAKVTLLMMKKKMCNGKNIQPNRF